MKLGTTMLKIAFLVVFFFFSAQLVHAQKIKFKDDFHNFGKLPKSSPNVEHTFTFKNYGDKPVSISKVNTSCGCTTPEYTKKPVKPGEKGSVKVVFSPAGQNGFFQKNITVKTNSNNVYHLMIEGVVRDQEQQAARAKRVLPVEKGALQFNKNTINFGDVQNNSIDSAELVVYNSANKTIQIHKTRGSESLTIKDMPIKLKPDMRKKLTVYFEPLGATGSVANFGTRKASLILVTNDMKKPYKEFSTQSRIYPKIEKPAPQEKRPRVKLNKRVLNFGEVSSGFYLKTGVKITNKGSETLKIMGTDAQTCSCIAKVPKNTTLKPGESTRLKIDFNAKNFNGRVREEVRIYTNDPERPFTTVILKAFVQS